ADLVNQAARQYRSGTQAVFAVWRDGKKVDVSVTLEEQPVPAAELPWWNDKELEYSAREIAFDDRVKLQLATEAKGVLIESAVPAGWAALAGLRADDVVEQAGGAAITNLEELKQARAKAVSGTQDWWVLLVRRRGQTLFVEMNLKPTRVKS
ncbi:MAG: hypothetical protein V4773_18865, partial [Verrucomicrobiota bacterium]